MLTHKLQILLVALISVAGGHLYGKDRSHLDPWYQLLAKDPDPITFSQFLNTAKMNCHTDEVNKVGCWASVNTILEILGYDESIEANATIRRLPHRYVEVLEAGEYFSRVRVKRDPSSEVNLVGDSKAVERARFEARRKLEERLSVVRKSSIDWTPVIDELKEQVFALGPKEEVKATISALNAWLWYVDPHSLIQPPFDLLNALVVTNQKPLVFKKIFLAQQKIGWLFVPSLVEEGICEKVKNGIQELESKGASRLVLNLKNNSGGYTHLATCIADLFLPVNALITVVDPFKNPSPKIIWYGDVLADTQGRDLAGNTVSMTERVMYFSKEDPITSLPLFVIVNAGTASSAEMLVGALKENNRAVIVGEQTNGKGSVQNFYSAYYSPDLIFSKTVSFWYLPSGQTVQGRGITPDVKILGMKSSPYPREETFPTMIPVADIDLEKWDGYRVSLGKCDSRCVAHAVAPIGLDWFIESARQ